MSTNLYEILGVQRDATDDQSAFNPRPCSCPPPQRSASFAVRKAYKKRALQTHPDRVPQEKKAEAGDEFRKVPLIPASALLRRLLLTYFRSTTHTKCLSIRINARYVVAYLGVPWSTAPYFRLCPLGIRRCWSLATSTSRVGRVSASSPPPLSQPGAPRTLPGGALRLWLAPPCRLHRSFPALRVRLWGATQCHV